MPKQTAPDGDSAPIAGRPGQPRARFALRIFVAGCVALPSGWESGEAAENPALGRYLSVECTACHQLSGKSGGGIPPIIGWPEDQFVAVLASYGRKERGGEVMQTIAARLSDAEMRALAAYFGALSSKP